MRKLTEMIKNETNANFVNLRTALMTYNRNAPVCGSPAWRYAYHTIHSADKWYFNPNVFTEPSLQREACMDNPDIPCDVVLSDRELLDYLEQVRIKTMYYLDGLSDEQLYEYPESCPFMRLELILRQFRHISFHTGMLNGQTAERTGRFPVYVSPNNLERLEKGYYDEG
ncbi:DinB family protein [Ruminococcus sp.]|uniref:DinB family protein n=1 Tax=Ruminococcus sp. TaxID=41978 RepID=UPI0025D833DE|nr:DinB family protein [Ruminococcus sp.]